MRYYYHEKERLLKLINNKKLPKIPVKIFLRDRSSIVLNAPQISMIQTYVKSDPKSLKILLKDTNTITSFLNKFTENIKKINKIDTRRKK